MIKGAPYQCFVVDTIYNCPLVEQEKLHNNIGDVVMITVMNAESYLKNKIGEGANDIKKVWETFKAFCTEPVEGEEDKEILFQCGVYDFTGEELFHLDFVRQFTIYEEDEYSRMEQLHCEFLFKQIDELRKLETGEW